MVRLISTPSFYKKFGKWAHLCTVFVETPELPADTIVFLTKEKRNWLNGRYINVTWDMPQLMAMEDNIVKEDKLKVRLVI